MTISFFSISKANYKFVSVFVEVPNASELELGWSKKVSFVATFINHSLSKMIKDKYGSFKSSLFKN